MTDLIHVEDLTTNTTRFDMLDEDTRLRMFALMTSERQYWSAGRWVDDDLNGTIDFDRTYRQKPSQN